MTFRPSLYAWSLAFAAALFLAAPAAHALPALQLYSPDAEWDAAHETWVISASTFELWVIGDVGGKGSILNVDLAASYYGAAGTIDVARIDPTDAIPTLDPNPTLDRPGYSGLVTHEEFSLADGHTYWTIGDFTSVSDNIIDVQPGKTGTSTGEIKKYTITVTGYDSVHFDAFDHYYTGNGATAHYTFAPFTHDAGTTQEIPEPSMMLLFGTGLIGLAFRARRAR
jgi:hypothetical protein